MTLIWKSNTRFLNKNGAEAQAKSQAAFNQTLQNNYNAEFSQWSSTLNYLMDSVKPLIAGGPGQYGFGTTQDAALRTDLSNQVAGAFSGQKAALDNQLVAEGGGDSSLPSGARAQLDEQLGVEQARALAEGQTAVTEAGYQQGNQNYLTGLSTLGAGIGQMNPNAFAGAESSQSNATTNAIHEANASGWGSILTQLAGSAIGAAAGAATGGLNKIPSVISNFSPGMAESSGLFGAAPSAPNIGAFGMPPAPDLFGTHP